LLLAVVLTGFRSAAAAPIKVTPDGQGGFASIQAAIDSVPNQGKAPVVIEIAPGRYDERITIPKNKPFITLRGTGDTPADVWVGGTLKAPGAILTANADDFRCEHLTLEDLSEEVDNQTRSALVVAGQRQAFEDCTIKGRHNTLFVRPGASAYLHFCRVTGTGDIIYGAGTAFLDTCEVTVLWSTGTIASPNTPRNVDVGLIFSDCRFSGPPNGSGSLMRPWGADGAAVFIRCAIDERFSRVGWTPWNGRETTCRAAEFGSTTADGKPLDLSERPAWVRRLTEEEVRRYSMETVFHGWNPHTPPTP
jgi:pectinesterase